MNEQIPPASGLHQKPSAEGTKARPGALAVSPAIGPLPAIYVPPSPGQAATFETEIDLPEPNEQLAGLIDAGSYRDLCGA